MKNSMHLLVGIVASLALALPQLAGQESARTVAEPHPRVELPRTLRLIDLHDVLLAEAAYPDIELPKDAEPADEGATAAQHRHELGEPVAVSRDLDEAARVAKRAVQWQVMLRIWMQPPLDADRDRLEMLPNGTLIANLTADAHAWLDEFLALQRDEHFMLGTQFQIVIGPKEVIRQILPTGKDQVFLSEAESQRMLTEAQQASRSDVIFAPKLMSFFRTRCSISSYDRIAYIRDWKVERIEPGHQQIADPHIGTVRNGQGILVRGVALAADRIGLEVEFENSVVKQPIRTATVKLPMDGGRDVEIGLPEVDTQRLSTQLVMQPGRCAVFRGPLADGEREVVVFVHAQRLDPHAVGEPLEGK